jgi:hypothetical protein
MQTQNTMQNTMTTTTTTTTTNTNLSIGQLIDPNFDPVGAAKQTNWVAVAGLHQNWAVFGTQNCEEAAQFVAQLRQEHEYESDCADLDEEMLLEELDND